MRTEYTVTSGSYTLNLENVIGAVARDGWLNDAVIQFVCETICSSNPRTQLLSSLAFEKVSLPTPTTQIETAKFVVHPVHPRGIVGASSS